MSDAETHAETPQARETHYAGRHTAAQPPHEDAPAAGATDELAQATARLRDARAKRSLRPRQAALIVALAGVVGAMVAPLWWLSSRGPASEVPANDPAVKALLTYERSLDGNPQAQAQAQAVRFTVHVRTEADGSTVASSRSGDGTCYVLHIPAITAPGTATTGVKRGASTDCP